MKVELRPDELIGEDELRELVELVRSKVGDNIVVVARRDAVDVIPNERYL